MDHNTLIDELIVTVNEIPRALMSGEYVEFCKLILQMVQGLAQLKTELAEGGKDVSD